MIIQSKTRLFRTSITHNGHINQAQGRRKHLKLGGARNFKGTFLIKQIGHFLKQKGQFLDYRKILGGGHVPGS